VRTDQQKVVVEAFGEGANATVAELNSFGAILGPGKDKWRIRGQHSSADPEKLEWRSGTGFVQAHQSHKYVFHNNYHLIMFFLFHIQFMRMDMGDLDTASRWLVFVGQEDYGPVLPLYDVVVPAMFPSGVFAALEKEKRTLCFDQIIVPKMGLLPRFEQNGRFGHFKGVAQGFKKFAWKIAGFETPPPNTNCSAPPHYFRSATRTSIIQ
jgi:hypothetical protein